jgi:hypothetical protein
MREAQQLNAHLINNIRIPARNLQLGLPLGRRPFGTRRPAVWDVTSRHVRSPAGALAGCSHEVVNDHEHAPYRLAHQFPLHTRSEVG